MQTTDDRIDEPKPPRAAAASAAPTRRGSRRLGLRRIGALAAIAAIAGVAAIGVGCVRVSNGTWLVKSAATPEGWPKATPVGEIEVKTYPEYRAAAVDAADVEDGTQSQMFMSLFRHISRNDIAMTTPVDMAYAQAPDSATPKMSSMAFLYRTQDLGPTGTDGAVRIVDVEPRTYASLGVRGDYTRQRYERGVAALQGWLAGQDEWTATGPPRYLGYNGPFVPTFFRYGEVQVPVDVAAERRSTGDAESEGS